MSSRAVLFKQLLASDTRSLFYSLKLQFRNSHCEPHLS
ncbi:Uncharacterized protein HZ326_30490, partial [Fusarium oxysporum f. sp. albedinis]